MLSQANLADVYVAAHKLDLATPLLEKTLEQRTAKFGADHPDTVHTMNWLAWAYRESRHFDKAEPLYQQVWEKRTKKPGPGDKLTIDSENAWGVCLVPWVAATRLSAISSTAWQRSARLPAPRPIGCRSIDSAWPNYTTPGVSRRKPPSGEPKPKTPLGR